VIIRKSVVLPAPFGPTRPIFSPRFSAAEASMKRMRWLFDLLMFSIRIMRKTAYLVAGTPMPRVGVGVTPAGRIFFPARLSTRGGSQLADAWYTPLDMPPHLAGVSNLQV
jgi:hypothetical protein